MLNVNLIAYFTIGIFSYLECRLTLNLTYKIIVVYRRSVMGYSLSYNIHVGSILCLKKTSPIFSTVT